MNFNEKEHSRFIQCLDRTAEKNPFLWLPCVVLIALALAAEHIRDRRRNAENNVRSVPKLERKPFFLRAVAVTLTAALSLMLVPAAAFDAFADEYGSEAEQTVFSETSEAEDISDAEGSAVSEEITVPEETPGTEETAVPEEASGSEETAVPEETPVSEETPVPEETAGSEEASEPEEPVFSAEETALNDGISPLADHEHTFHRWEKTEYEHWQVCTVCNQEYNRSGHDFAIKVVNPTQSKEGSKTFTCTICGYSYTKPLPTVSHDHAFTNYWSSDTDSHWHICINPDCEAIGDPAYHTFGNWEGNNTYHWKVCSVCNRSTRYTVHNFVWKNNADGHYRECTECGYTETQNAHIFVTKYDTSKHWQECSNKNCGYKKDEEAHDLSSTGWQTNGSAHWKGCPCGYSTEASSANHKLQWYTDNDDLHWQYCSVCGWESNKVSHSLSWTHDSDFDAFGQHWLMCSCGYEIGWGTHDFNAWNYKSNDDSHWYECVDCGMKIDIEEHNYKWYFHDDEHWRECEACGKIANEGEHLYKLEHNEDEHWNECVCGKKLSAEIHHYSNGDFTLDEDGETSVKRFYCTICGYYYNVPITHTHTPEDEWKHNNSDHWHECTSCGKPVDPKNHDYTAKVTLQPTETEKGTRVYTCSVCGFSYSEAIPELEHVHVFGKKWNKDSTAHWHECACGEKTDIARHLSDGGTVTDLPTAVSEGLRVYTCTVCGYIIKTEPVPALVPPVTMPVTVSEAPLKQPYITNSAEVKGWKDIAVYINASPDGAVIPITMNGTYEMPKDIARCIRNRNVTLNIYMDAGQVWTVNGLNVTSLKTVNFCIAELSNAIPPDVIDGLGSEIKPKEYFLFHSGDFGFSAALTMDIGNKFNGYYASLYHYNTVTKQLEFVDEKLVENSLVTFVLTHASYYAVSFSSIPFYDDMSAGAGLFENSVPVETSAMPETSGVAIPPIKLPQIMKYSGKKRRYRILKKRRLDDLVFVL